MILGQDPYHGIGQAHGLCFSVPKGVKTPPSLVNIFKELKTDLNIEISRHGDLTDWALQGVFLLNSVLTVRSNEPASHQKRGWEVFTNSVISLISEMQFGVVFILWGKSAFEKEKLIDQSKHLVLKAAHPSPLSAYNGFFGSKHFSKTNDFLKVINKEPINWKLKAEKTLFDTNSY